MKTTEEILEWIEDIGIGLRISQEQEEYKEVRAVYEGCLHLLNDIERFITQESDEK